MRLAKPIETIGVFWLPERPDATSTGILKISESSKITVDLAGFGDNPLVSRANILLFDTKARDPLRIVGTVREGGPMTLDHCLPLKAFFSLPSGLSTPRIYAGIALVGAQYEKDEEALFRELSFSVEGLDTWLSVSGIENQTDYANRRGVIQYHVPDHITFDLPDDVQLSFRFSMTGPTISLPTTEARIQQISEVWVKLKEPQPIEYFSSLAFKVCNFLTLALDKGVSIKSMTGYLDQAPEDEKSHRTPVKIYSEFAPRLEAKPTIRLHDALFRYPDVSDQLGIMLARWFENYETFEPAFNLYFASRTGSSEYLDARVLWLTQALEAMHRRSSAETQMCQTEFTSLLESLVQSCPEGRQQWLRTTLQHANEPRFRRRVKVILEPYKRWFGNSSTRDALVNTICDTRNYLTHYDEATIGDRAKGPQELYELCKQLEALFQLHLLGLLGIDGPAIDSIVRNNRSLRDLLCVQAN